MYMLDTNIIIYSMRHGDSECAKRLETHSGNDTCISVVTLGELEFGIRNSSDPERNRYAVEQILSGIPVLDFDRKAAVHFGAILAEMKRKNRYDVYRDRDKMIAAHARSLGCVLVTDNIRDFSDVSDLMLANWREPDGFSPAVR